MANLPYKVPVFYYLMKKNFMTQIFTKSIKYFL